MDFTTHAALGLGLVLLVPGVAFAGGSTFVMSLTDNAVVSSGALDDEELVLVGGGATPRKFLSDATLALYFGDRNSDGAFDEPNDIDALAILPIVPGTPAIGSVVFSLLTDQNGIKDGDVVRFDPADPIDGLEVLFTEAFFVSAIAASDGNIDIDALAFGPDGSVWFSLAEDEATGPNSVVLQDETIFAIAPGATTAIVAFSALQIETIAKNALGITTAIADVLCLEFDGGNLLFTVQSPTAHDATVLSTENGGTIHQGASEASFAFGADVECDALALAPTALFASLDAEPSVAAPGGALALALDGLTPNSPAVLVLSGVFAMNGAGWTAPGFGALVASPFDPIFLSCVANAPALVGIADGLGILHYTGVAPVAGVSGLDLAVQGYDGVTGRFSAPIALELLP